MDNIEKLINKYALVSDQVDRKELATVLEALQLTLDKHIEGDVVEFGCYKGTTSLFLMRLIVVSGQQKRLWLYDSFQGLPEKTAEDGTMGDEFRPGELAATKAEVVRNFAHANLPKPIIKKGWFSDISENDLPDKISFAYFDGDYYESITDSFNQCTGRWTDGAMVVVDDYTNSHLPGAALAVDKWVSMHQSLVRSFTVKNSLAIISLVL